MENIDFWTPLRVSMATVKRMTSKVSSSEPPIEERMQGNRQFQSKTLSAVQIETFSYAYQIRYMDKKLIERQICKQHAIKPRTTSLSDTDLDCS